MKIQKRRTGLQGQSSIILFGTWGEDNTGDDIMLLSQIEGIKTRCPKCRIICFSGNPSHTRTLLERELSSLEGIRIVYTGRRGLREPGVSLARSLHWIGHNISTISRSRLLLIGPGNQIQDVTRRMRVLFFISRAILAWILRTPFAFIGIGYYELRSRFCRRLFRFTCNRAAFISTRDKGSARKISMLSITGSHIWPMADFSFSQHYTLHGKNRKEQQPPLIGLTTRIFLPQVFAPPVARNFEICLADLLRSILKTMSVRLRFFPFYKGSCWNDSVALERLKEKLHDIEFYLDVCDFSSLGELRKAIADCDALIGVRYHSVLLAVQGGVPPLAISYAHKTRRFMQENGLKDYVFNVEDVTYELLWEGWKRLWMNRDRILKKLPSICERERNLAAQHFDLIFQTVQRH